MADRGDDGEENARSVTKPDPPLPLPLDREKKRSTLGVE